MFDNAGEKIQILAKVLFWITFLAGSIVGLVFCFGEGIALFLLLIPLSFFSGWLGSIAMYAFGELCENVYFIKHNINNK